MESVPAATCSTVVIAMLDLRTGTLTYACAGHPPPMLLEPDGSASTLWGGRSLPLGITPHLERDEATIGMAPGSRLLLYTDGLVERRDVSLGRRFDELADALAATSGLGSEEQLGELESRTRPGPRARRRVPAAAERARAVGRPGAPHRLACRRAPAAVRTRRRARAPRRRPRRGARQVGAGPAGDRRPRRPARPRRRLAPPARPRHGPPVRPRRVPRPPRDPALDPVPRAEPASAPPCAGPVRSGSPAPA